MSRITYMRCTKKFVISPIDKASNNFAIICKKFYLEVIQGELGISEKIKGNSVYKPVNQNIDNIIEKHVDSIKNDFTLISKKWIKISLSYIGYPNNIKILTNFDSLLVQPTVPQKLYQFNYLWP